MFPEESLPSVEPPREASPFPVSKEGAERAVREISVDPMAAFTRKRDILRETNPYLLKGLSSVEGFFPRSSARIAEGATFAHTILRASAAEARVSLPRLTEDSFDAFLRSMQDDVDSTAGKENIVDVAARDISTIAETDPVFVETIRQIAGHRLGNQAFFLGVDVVYRNLKAATEAEQMNKNYDFTGDDQQS